MFKYMYENVKNNTGNDKQTILRILKEDEADNS